ncbi:MAG: hypothetical protein ACO1PI_16935 [Bacteroidota bacterium]
MSSTPLEKNIELSLARILELLNPSTYVIKLPRHYLENSIFEITKGDRQYDFSSSCPIPRGLQNHKEIQFERTDNIEFSNANQTLFASGKHIVINHISYDEDSRNKVFGGSITSLSTCKNTSEFDGRFHRCIIPVGQEVAFNILDFQRNSFNTSNKKVIPYVALNISGDVYHLFNYKLGMDYYLVIDSLQKSSLNQFQKKCFNALLALGYVNGNLIHDECFIMAFRDDKMDAPENILYHSMRASIITNQATFTTNPFSVNNDKDFERDESGSIKQEIRDKLDEDIQNFSKDVFSKLASLFFENEKLQRAVLIFIQSHIASLEIRIPNYYVAIEAITGHISGELATKQNSLSPIKDTKIASNLIEEIKKIASKVKSENTLNEDVFNLNVLQKNIEKLNAPPNADKLSESFKHIGYTLTKEQRDILKDRNRFLHGSFLKTVNDDTEFREALHTALRLQFMIAVLVYKLAGFTGKIINYASLWSHITEKTIDEERLIKI